MVKAGKFNTRGIQWAAHPNSGLGQYGANDPIKKIWWGTLTKREGASTTEPVDLGGATWGFSQIEFSRVCSNATVNGGSEGGTVRFMCHQVATLYLEATLGVGNMLGTTDIDVGLLIIGR